MKILASDYDGTLKVDGVLSETTKQAIEQWRAAGNVFGIVTGRSTATIKEELKQQGLCVDFLVCNNGGVILDETLTILQLSLIDFEVASKILDELADVNCTGYVLNDGTHRSKKAMNHVQDSLHDAPSTISIEEILKHKTIAQIVVGFDEQEQANRLAQYMNAQFSEEIEAFANVNCVDIVPKNCSKANGILYIAKREGYALDDIYTIGDSYNDLSMLEQFHGATLEHAVADIKQHREYVVHDVADFLNIIKYL